MVEAGSFSEAARGMGTTKASVSKAVARLEKALQVKLLNRSTRRIGLSEAGREIYQHALRMIDAGRALQVLPAARPVGMFGSQVLAVYRENRFLPQKVRVFIDYLLEQWGERPAWDDFLASPAGRTAPRRVDTGSMK